MTPVINTNGLSKSFGDVTAIKPVDLTVNKHAIIVDGGGDNGRVCGHSTGHSV